ncbi:hypothetical protein HBI56_091740 [Parastagonospora nodorum]|uniref:Glycoside hydrolase 131 catalytic N-terminal domain-containing protein n=2 Tax=Phaeosphaeria nodorum (strain SN15 / ATCC MYA-4574 / FGSC 10173) TaxID=321614 RepID=A0A7U2I145_PHANO|nr:hypothetical protein SNOG_16527 [Parastagonospora nodorum SN15]KAH3914268.1 hypothetical protein HBH56_086830 [Parastagonospora nodorum]EAT76067.1 hypothetical protein SNOG_16527 [Parastagonospora nodorum SN15]KAH3921202.1 hypothetical protein HBH54_243650 [Parastagonospora nodorum]KAH3945684.1 hypothetical protein HBH53_138890 [Parastagonospora nodorum]KAH3956725.1 hypothetical protein HBH51_236430 [Parastagonospora nodorum]
MQLHVFLPLAVLASAVTLPSLSGQPLISRPDPSVHLAHVPLPPALHRPAIPLISRPVPPRNVTNIRCPIIFDGRVPKNLTLTSFDSASTSPYSPSFVKGENTTWASILLLPRIASSRFDEIALHKPLEVTIDKRSIFRAGEKLQLGFRRAGLLLKDDTNDPGTDAADAGVVTFHWSVKQDAARPLNLTHEYMNVWHEQADYKQNQFTFVGGIVLPGDGGLDQRGDKWRVQNAKSEFVFEVSIEYNKWQNFGVQLDYVNNTIKVFYSVGMSPLKVVTHALPNENGGGGQLQIGIAKKPTETQTVVFDGYQEFIPLRGEGQIYGGIFVEKSDGGCTSL